MLNSTAKEVVSRQHSFGSPVLKTAGDKALIYNLGGLGYQIEAYASTVRKESTETKILAGALAENGSYALLTEGEGCYGQLMVYTAKNEEKFLYRFSKYYPISGCLKHDGHGGIGHGCFSSEWRDCLRRLQAGFKPGRGGSAGRGIS